MYCHEAKALCSYARNHASKRKPGNSFSSQWAYEPIPDILIGALAC